MGQWSYITINGRNNTKLSIISTYRVCETRIQDSDPSTAFSQQLDKIEERGDLQKDVRKQMISDLTIFISKLKVKNYEIILDIDTNESFDPRKRDSDTCIRLSTH